RRHTIFSRDWSSDVCSSDLGLRPLGALALEPGRGRRPRCRPRRRRVHQRRLPPRLLSPVPTPPARPRSGGAVPFPGVQASQRSLRLAPPVSTIDARRGGAPMHPYRLLWLLVLLACLPV